MKNTAIIFTGQGSQEHGMGRDTAEANPEIMDLWKKAEKISGTELRSIYWESNDAALMADTRSLQPAITLVNFSLWMNLAHHLTPQACAGHSLGEYSAYAASGALPPEKVLEVVALRGRLMAEADPDGIGGMSAVLKLSREDVESVAREIAEQTGELLIVANYNTPAQFVLSGTKKALQAAAPVIKAKKGRAMPLAVSSAFHTPLMAKAGKELEKALRKLTWSSPKFPLYSNVTATPVSDGAALCDLACKQVTSPVLWIDTVTNQYQAGIRQWLELGPKAVLSRMIKPILDTVTDAEALTLSSLENVQKFVAE